MQELLHRNYTGIYNIQLSQGYKLHLFLSAPSNSCTGASEISSVLIAVEKLFDVHLIFFLLA